MLSQYAEPGYALALLERGPTGRAYLLKERVSDVDQLRRAPSARSPRGGSVIDPKVVEALVDARAPRPTSRPSTGSRPASGRSWRRWPRARTTPPSPPRSCLSERAVEKHINSIFSKLGLTEETDAHRRVKAVLLYLSDQGG